jgi:hypothetical protein
MVSKLVFLIMLLGIIFISGCIDQETFYSQEKPSDQKTFYSQDNPSQTSQNYGCQYDNPSCFSGHDCVNNVCIEKKGCQFDNPSCNEGYGCINNQCVENKPKKESYNFTYSENTEPYLSAYCDKINPYDLSVREAAADAIREHPGRYSINQLFDIYDWVKQNIIYQTVPLAGIPYASSETLATKSGDCKNQAVLIASMVRSIGGTAKVVADPDCVHAYAIVYFGSIKDLSSFTSAVTAHYGSGIIMNYFTLEEGIWVIFDPAGGMYPGDTLPECSGNRKVYFITSCMDCVNTWINNILSMINAILNVHLEQSLRIPIHVFLALPVILVSIINALLVPVDISLGMMENAIHPVPLQRPIVLLERVSIINVLPVPAGSI